MISLLFAAAFTFTATATGVEKGTPLEFFIGGSNTDRDYETMFILEDSVGDFLTRLEKAGFPTGVPTDSQICQLWPVGAVVSIEPDVLSFVDREMPEGIPAAPIVYTAGSRLPSGCPDAATNMPAAVMSFYSLAQAPFVYDGIYEQGVVYGSHKAKVQLKKGQRVKFTLSCDPSTLPQTVEIVFDKDNVKLQLAKIRELSSNKEVSVKVGFSGDLSVFEASAIASALALLDSPRVKINGRFNSDLFYRAFLPLVKWRSRQERLTQPFEIYIGETTRILYIEEDWTVEGNDPKLIKKEISSDQMQQYAKTDTVFFYVTKETPIKRIQQMLGRLPKSVINHYVFGD